MKLNNPLTSNRAFMRVRLQMVTVMLIIPALLKKIPL